LQRFHNVFEIAGPLCTPLDTLGRGVHLPDADIGDILTIFQSGAYGRSDSPLQFLSHPAPLEVLVEKNNFKVIRQKGKDLDLIRGTALYFDSKGLLI